MTLKEMVSSESVSFDKICTNILHILVKPLANFSSLVRKRTFEVLIGTEWPMNIEQQPEGLMRSEIH